MRYDINFGVKKALRKSFFAAIGLSVAIMGSCSASDEEEELHGDGIPVEVTFSLSSRSQGLPTRGDGGTAVDPEENEKIRDWWIVFVDKYKTVRKILNRSDFEAGIPSGADPVEEETFRCILPTGTYDVYAFANVSQANLTKAVPAASFTVGEDIDGNLDNAVWNAAEGIAGTELNLLDIAPNGIPMTGFLKQIKVDNTIEEKFSIEVVRMTAKMDIRFINPGDQTVTVTKIGLNPVTKSGVSLFPKNETGIGYAHLGNYSYTPLANAVYGELTYIPQGGVTVTKSVGQTQKAVFYTKESFSSDNGPFTLTLGVKYGDETQEKTLKLKPTQQIRGYINRNDWIVLTVKLSRYVVATYGIFYPPIGGYPAMTHTYADDGSDIYSLGTWGEFSIFPEFLDQLSGEGMPAGRYRMEMTVEDTDGIFTTTPTLTRNAGKYEIYGEAGTQTGSATLTITVDVFDSENPGADEQPKETIIHKVKIVRAN